MHMRRELVKIRGPLIEAQAIPKDLYPVFFEQLDSKEILIMPFPPRRWGLPVSNNSYKPTFFFFI